MVSAFCVLEGRVAATQDGEQVIRKTDILQIALQEQQERYDSGSEGG
jgi:hypothetical protein